nr:copia protein [Tanacetum cinerariifolium]
MTGNLKLLINFIWKFMGTLRFRNDHVAAILVFGDLQWGNILITRVFSLKDWVTTCSRNDLVSGLLKFKYHKEHLCPSCEQGKSKRASHPPKPVPNSRQRLHLLHMDLCGPMRIASGNGKRYVLVIVDNYSRYAWNDREYIGKLGAKGDIGFFIGYSTDSCAYRIYNRRKKKIIESMNVSFDELSAMAFEHRSSKPGLQSMTSGKISSGLDLTYAPSTITTQQPTEGELDLLFEAIYDDYIDGQPSATARTVMATQEPQVCQTSMASTSIATPYQIQQTHPFIQQISQSLHRMLTSSIQMLCSMAIRLSIRLRENCILAWLVERRRVCMSTEGFIDADHPSHVYKLKKALYGLKQAPKAWYIQLFSNLMKSCFEMSMMGEMTFFLGLQVNQYPCGVFINQSKYVLEILKKSRIQSCDPVGTPMEIKDKLDLDQNGTPVDATKYRSMIGALMYLTSSRTNIMHATCLCARYQAKPTENHLKEVKRIFRYLRGTVNTGLWYSKDSGFKLTGFSDVDYAGCKDTFKSTFGGAQFLGEKLVSWSSKKQDCMALSIAEVEYVSLSACCAQVLWMLTQLTDYGFHFNKILIYCDSKSAIAISRNPVQHLRTKHIAVRYHFIKEHVEKGTIELYFVKTDYQLADLFTKALPTDHFNYLVCRLGMCSLSPQELDCLAKSQ